jgi:mono/diheme cytochrome c family protein
MALAATLSSCAAPGAQRTIEPEAPPEDQFILSRERPGDWVAPSLEDYPIHLGPKWYPYRAGRLGISAAEAVARDNRLSEQSAPGKFWDEQTATEAVSIWSALCNECHGGRRRLKDALEMPAPPSGWGADAGLFFGNRKAYREIFATISGGGPPAKDGTPSEMPSWRDKLSREQIWSLIYFLEYQSGGIEGRFPPSLYPKMPIEKGGEP